jgi:hypothetical protein
MLTNCTHASIYMFTSSHFSEVLSSRNSALCGTLWSRYWSKDTLQFGQRRVILFLLLSLMEHVTCFLYVFTFFSVKYLYKVTWWWIYGGSLKCKRAWDLQSFCENSFLPRPVGRWCGLLNCTSVHCHVKKTCCASFSFINGYTVWFLKSSVKLYSARQFGIVISVPVTAFVTIVLI